MAQRATRQREDRSSSRDLQREETRRRVRKAALAVFRRDGFRDARMDDVAKVAGVSYGSVYFHFPTKEDALLAVLDEAEERIAAAVDALPKAASVERVLAAVCSSMAAEWEPAAALFPHVGMVAVRRSAEDPGGREDPLRTALAGRFAVAEQRRELSARLPAPALADLFLVTLFAGALGWCAQPKLSLRSVLSAVAELFLDGARRTKK
jgi:AcrR family transcriptional regulator